MRTRPSIVGIDFGTTSLSAVIISIEDATIEKVITYTTNAYIESSDVLKKEQSLEILTGLFDNLLSEIDSVPDIHISAYGFTGQMHGIIGLDKEGTAVTNLVTWQDKSGEIELENGTKILDVIKDITGDESISNGYGIVTLYKWLEYDKRKDIESFCTVADYFANILGKNKKVVINPSMSHSIGLYDVYSDKWNTDSIQKLGLEKIIFPQIVNNNYIIGYVRKDNGDIPVVTALGDNQASFSGSVINKEDSILLNVGTGTQLSFLAKRDEIDKYQKYIDGAKIQIRPFDKDSFLIATSFINGGTVYKSLFNFFKETGQKLFGIEDIDEDLLWRNMENLGKQNLYKADSLSVCPILEEERNITGQKASITNIDTTNLNPGDFITGFLIGLAEYYKTGFFPELADKINYICGSGNGLKKNKLFREIIERQFEHPLYLTSYGEEAAVGAALNAASAAGVINDEIEGKALLSGISKKNQ